MAPGAGLGCSVLYFLDPGGSDDWGEESLANRYQMLD